MERKIAINAGVGCGIPISEVIPLVKAAGFDGIFTSWDEDRPNEEWANIIAREGLIYQSIHSPFDHVEYLWEEEEAGEAYTDKLIRCIEHCERFDVPVMVVHPIKGMDRHTPCERGIRRFARLVEAAEKTRVKLAFENVENREYLDMIMERLGGSDSVGFCWDTGHEICYNFGEDMMASYGKKLIATHFNDNMGMADRSIVTWTDDAHMLPFDGIADWQNIMDRIRRDGYEGILTFEFDYNPKPGKNTHERYAKMTPEEYFAEAYRLARRVAAL